MNWRVIQNRRLQSKQSHAFHWPQLLLFTLVILLSTKLSAQESDPSQLGLVDLSSKKYGEIQVSIRRVENVLGMPYQLDIKGKCPKKEIAVIHSENFCDVKLTSPKLVDDGTIEIQVRDVDAKKFNRLSRKLDPEDLIKLKPTCLKAGKTVRYNLADLCE